MQNLKYWTIIIISLIITFTNNIHAQIIVKGSTTVEPIARSFLEYYQSKHPGFKYNLVSQGSGFGALGIINGECDIAIMSRFMTTDEFKKAVKNNRIPVFHHLVRDGLAMVVNEENPVNSITVNQIRAIYDGKITNWKELGGNDSKIIVISRAKTSGTREVFDEKILDGKDSLYSNYEVIGNKDVEVLVQKNKNAIGYVGLGFLEGVKTLKVNGIKPNFESINDDVYPLTRALFMVTNGYPKKGTPIYDLVQMSRMPDGIEILKKLGWYAPKQPSFDALFKDFIFNYWELSIAILVIILILMIFSIILSRLNIRLNKTIIKRDQEIENRIKAEAALRISDERYRHFVENFQGIAYQSDYKSFKPILFHGAVEEITGYSAENFINEDVIITEIIHPNDIKFVLEQRDMLISNDNYIAKDEFRIINKNGDVRWVFDISRSYKLDNTDSQIIQGSLYDITPKKRFEEALKDSEKKFRNLVENSPTGIMSINKRGKLIQINSKLIEILELDDIDDTMDYNIFDNKQLDEFNEKVMECFKSGQPTHHTGEFITGFRKKKFLKYYLNPMFGTNNKVHSIIANVEDYTERKKVESELQRISKLESLGTLAGGIAHNLKNILSAISLNIDIINYNPTDLNNSLDRIKKSVNQATALATRFQTFTKSSEPVKELVDIRKVIQEADSMALSGSNVNSEMQFENDIYNLYLDPKQINEVFLNLIINAKQAMPMGGRILYKAKNLNLTDKELGNLQAGKYVLIEFIDHGCGIPKENLQMIFDPFFTTKESGNGLGLSTVHYIVQKHNGHINVYSEEGKGTTFKIYLPATIDKQSTTVEIQENLKFVNNAKILLMDDDDDIIESIKGVSQFLNYHFTFVPKGEDAIEQYRNSILIKEPFSAVILDLTNKKGMGGEETFKKLKELDPEVKAIVFSGYSDQPSISRYQEFGFVAKLEKPITVKELADTLFNVLSKN